MAIGSGIPHQSYKSVADLTQDLQQKKFEVNRGKTFDVNGSRYQITEKYEVLREKLEKVSHSAVKLFSSKEEKALHKQDKQVAETLYSYLLKLRYDEDTVGRAREAALKAEASAAASAPEVLHGDSLALKNAVSTWISKQLAPGAKLSPRQFYQLLAYTHRGSNEGMPGFGKLLDDEKEGLRTHYKSEVQNQTFNKAVRYAIREFGTQEADEAYMKGLQQVSRNAAKAEYGLGGGAAVSVTIKAGEAVFKKANPSVSEQTVREKYLSFQGDMQSVLEKLAEKG